MRLGEGVLLAVPEIVFFLSQIEGAIIASATAAAAAAALRLLLLLLLLLLAIACRIMEAFWSKSMNLSGLVQLDSWPLLGLLAGHHFCKRS